MSLSETVVTWRGVTLSGSRPTDYLITRFDGWDGFDSHQDGESRSQGHGRFDSPAWSDERVVTLGGRVHAQERDALMAALMAAMYPSDAATTEPLRVSHGGVVLTADARLTRYRPSVEAGYAVGYVPFAIEWRCADPLRYGDPISVSTTFPNLRGGLAYDLYTDGAGADLGYLDYGEPSDTGRIVVTNPGTAPAPITCQITGEVDALGFDVAQVGTDKRLRFVGSVPPGSVLVLDGFTGNVLIDGTADRAGQLTYRDWPVVPRGGSLELAFIPLGVNLGAQLTAVVRPGSW